MRFFTESRLYVPIAKLDNHIRIISYLDVDQLPTYPPKFVKCLDRGQSYAPKTDPGAELCPQNGPSGGGILLPVPIFTTVSLRGPYSYHRTKFQENRSTRG